MNRIKNKYNESYIREAAYVEAVRKKQGTKVAGQSRDRPLTFKQRFFDDSNNSGKFWEKLLNGHSAVVGGHATVGWLSNNVFSTFQTIQKNFEKVAERSRDSGRRSRDRRLTVKQHFFDVPKNSKKFWQKSLNGRATVVGGHATVGRLSNNVFPTFWANRKIFEKSRRTVTRQWSEIMRPLADCQTTIIRRFKQFRQILKKVAERSRDRGRRSRDRWPTVKQRFFDVSNNSEKFWKKSLNGHATVVGGHATVGWLSNNVFSTLQAIQKFFEKSRWTVTRQWSEVTRPSSDC